MKQHYLEAWQNTLTYLLGWSDADVSNWLRSAEETWDMTSPVSDIFHEAPSYWIVETIVAFILPDIFDSEYETVERAILRLLDSPHHDFTMETDWQYYKVGLNQIAQEHSPKNRLAPSKLFEYDKIILPTSPGAATDLQPPHRLSRSLYSLTPDAFAWDDKDPDQYVIRTKNARTFNTESMLVA